jgi:hypothetical protein
MKNCRMLPFILRWSAMGGLSLLGITTFGLGFTVALLVVVFTHELGHWVVCAAARCRATLWISPWGGLCTATEETFDDVFTSYGKGLLFLAGSGSCLLLACGIHVLRLIVPIVLPGSLSFWRCLELLCVVTNLLNLGALMPFLDGGRVLLMVVSVRAPWVGVLFGVIATVQGALLLAPFFPLFLIAFLVLLSALPVLAGTFCGWDDLLAPSERGWLALAWALLLGGSCLFFLDSDLREVANAVLVPPWREWYARHLPAL